MSTLALTTSDWLFFGLLIIAGGTIAWRLRDPLFKRSLSKLWQNPIGMASFAAILCYLSVAILDSVHTLPTDLHNLSGHKINHPISLLSSLFAKRSFNDEKTYSAPLAVNSFSKETVIHQDGTFSREFVPLRFTAKGNLHDRSRLIKHALMRALLWSLALFASLVFAVLLLQRLKGNQAQHFRTPGAKAFYSTLYIFLFLGCAMYQLSLYYHVLGTGKVGQDILIENLHSIRTGILIGVLTTFVVLPFAVLLGCAAGYYRRRVDDCIQYIYTTISSIPGVLLIAACILSLQVMIANHPHAFPTLASRDDVRLIALCVILGLTSWTGLCRVLRAETLKLSELDFVQAAKTQGVSNWRIICSHLIPNLTHIILITVVLDLSSLVLAEAVLSYVGIGVSPTMASWGNMINAARLQLAREPVVWWPLISAFGFMFVFVLSINLFADALRDAFDPRQS